MLVWRRGGGADLLGPAVSASEWKAMYVMNDTALTTGSTRTCGV